MNISFDVFNMHPELQQGLSSEEHIFYTTYLKFFSDKLELLKSEIEKEENEDENRFIEINILETNRGPATFWGYSDELKRKMESLFTNNDFENFKFALDNKQRGFHN